MKQPILKIIDDDTFEVTVDKSFDTLEHNSTDVIKFWFGGLEVSLKVPFRVGNYIGENKEFDVELKTTSEDEHSITITFKKIKIK